MPDFCTGCKAPLIWAVTPAGGRMPVDRTIDKDRGNVLLSAPSHFRGVVLAVVLTGDTLALAKRTQTPLRLEHHVTCPDAKLFT